jgi:DNA primase
MIECRSQRLSEYVQNVQVVQTVSSQPRFNSSTVQNVKGRCQRRDGLQKRAPAKRPSRMRTVTLSFPSGRKAEEIVVDSAAGLVDR